MSHRILWPVVACLGLGGLALVFSQSTAQRPGGGGPGGPPGMPGGMPGRFAVAHASAGRVLVLDTATGQVYRAKEEDFKKMSELPVTGGAGRDSARPRDGETSKEKPPARPQGDGKLVDRWKDLSPQESKEK